MNTADNLSSLKLLYVEDEADIREELESFFKLRVERLYVAEDGAQGWELFQEFKPDIVVSDINMPYMNGIELAEKIKAYNKDVPIILVTAFSDAAYMMKAIAAKVDRYVLKPVIMDQLEETLSAVAQNFLNRQLAEKVKQDRELIDTLNGFLEFSPNPIIIYEDEKVKFTNANFEKLAQKNKKTILENNLNINTLFEERTACLSCVDDIKTNYKDNKVSIRGEFGRNIFYLLKNEIKTSNGHSFVMYTFNDITLNEYQKIKIEHYTLRLEDFVKHMNSVHVDKYEKTILDEAPEPLKVEAEELKQEKRLLSDMEEKILKKSRMGQAFSAKDYAEDVDDYILDDVRELHLIEGEISDYLGIYEIKKDLQSILDIAGCLVKYSSVVAQLFEFEDLAFSIKTLADLLVEIDMNTVDDTKHRKIEIFMSAFMSDLMNWRMTIFVDCSANDIHYLDASLFSAILQLELIVSDKKAVVEESDEDDDFELF